jgi:hypothetical protein
MHDIFRDGFFTASTHSALTSTITHKSSVYPAFWLPPISTCVTVSPVYLLENKAPFTIRISSTLVGYNSRAPSSQPTVIIRHRSGLQTERPVTEARRETRLRATRRIEITQTVFTEIHYFARTVVISGFPEPGVAPRDCHSKLWALHSGGFTRIRWALRLDTTRKNALDLLLHASSLAGHRECGSVMEVSLEVLDDLVARKKRP